MFILHSAQCLSGSEKPLAATGPSKRARRFPPPPTSLSLFLSGGGAGTLGSNPRLSFPSGSWEPRKQSRRGRWCHLKAGPARGSQPSPAEGGGSAATAATSADPGRRPRTCGADCNCPRADDPGRTGGRWGRSAGSSSLAPVGSPWLLFLCEKKKKIPPPLRLLSQLFQPQSLCTPALALHPKFYHQLRPRIPHSIPSPAAHLSFYSQSSTAP